MRVTLARAWRDRRKGGGTGVGMARLEGSADDFVRNLEWLCARERSVSEICRRIGLNRQQFARYLNGAARPSAHNLARIGQFFGVTPADLYQPHGQFTRASAPPPHRSMRRGGQTLTSVFPGDLAELRRWCGYYHIHFWSPSQPDRVMRALVHLYEQDGMVRSHTVERMRHPETGLVSRAHFVGLVSGSGETLFLVERGLRKGRDVSEAILQPAHRDSRRWLTGILLAYSWRYGRPYASRCVWKRLADGANPRRAVQRCAAFPKNSREIDPIVMEHLASDHGDGVAALRLAT